MITASDLITSAMRDAGIIAASETPDDTDAAFGLSKLNMLIDSLNLESNWPFTTKRIKWDPNTPTSNQFTIGEGDGVVVQNISTDGLVVEVTSNRANQYFNDESVNIYNTTNYNSVGNIITVLTETKFQYSLPTTKAITSTVDGVGIVTIDTEVAHGFLTGDNVKITDIFSYSLTGVVTVLSSTQFTMVGNLGSDYTSGYTALVSDIIVTPAEKVGYSFRSLDAIPDIIAPRPLRMDVIAFQEPGYTDTLGNIPNDVWDRTSPLIGSGRPYKFTYYPDFPFGTLVFDNSFGPGTPLQLKYDSLILTYGLSDYLVLPTGYNSYLNYALAASFGPAYGVDTAKLEQMATKMANKIFQNNYVPGVLMSDTPRNMGNADFDIVNDRYFR